LNKWAKPAKKENYQKFQDNNLYLLLSQERLLRMHNTELRLGKEKTYTVDELMTDLNKGVFANCKPANLLIVINALYKNRL